MCCWCCLSTLIQALCQQNCMNDPAAVYGTSSKCRGLKSYWTSSRQVTNPRSRGNCCRSSHFHFNQVKSSLVGFISHSLQPNCFCWLLRSTTHSALDEFEQIVDNRDLSIYSNPSHHSRHTPASIVKSFIRSSWSLGALMLLSPPVWTMSQMAISSTPDVFATSVI